MLFDSRPPRGTLRFDGLAEQDGASAPSPASRVLSFTLVAVAFETLLWFFLYYRASPYGRPFALDPAHYVFHATYYGAWAHALVACPFLLWAAYAPRRLHTIGNGVQLLVVTLLLVIGVIDRECQRFLGMHTSLDWLRTYGALDRTPAAVLETLRADEGGAWSSLLSIAACLTYPVLALLVARKLRFTWLRWYMAAALLLTFVAYPTYHWNYATGGTIRLAKVRPALLIVSRELLRKAPMKATPAVLQAAVEAYQKHQEALDTRHLWRFGDPQYPLRKHYVGPIAERAGRRPNIIVLQLETFRAKDMRSTNPNYKGPQTTPFLDRLANDPKSALFRRYYASGVPTVYAFMTIHASLLSHPSKSIPAEATDVAIDGFPALLRESGYRTLHFTASDPDWDSQRVWLDRWYDEVHYDPKLDNDRQVFRAATQRIRQAGRDARPFLAYLVSISNHTPFRSPEKNLDLKGSGQITDALHNTMHYTDDVVRELFESLEDEPWFADTIWIITGDHGFDLGDRGTSEGHSNLRHETTWVPLIIHGRDPRLPHGVVSCVASHVDLAPTVLELADVHADNSFMGNSLLNSDCASSEALIFKGGNYAYETQSYSLFKPRGQRVHVYRGEDLPQDRELEKPPSALKTRAAELATAYRTVLVEMVDSNHVVPHTRAPQ